MEEKFEQQNEFENSKAKKHEVIQYIPPKINFYEEEIKDKEDADNILKFLENEGINENKKQDEEKETIDINKEIMLRLTYNNISFEEIIKDGKIIGKLKQINENEKEIIKMTSELIEIDLYNLFQLIDNNINDQSVNYIKNLIDEKCKISLNNQNIDINLFFEKLKTGQIAYPILKSCSRNDDVYAYNDEGDIYYLQRLSDIVIEDNTNEINEIKNKLLTKENMTDTDKTNMKICIDYISTGQTSTIDENGKQAAVIEQLKMLDNIQYGKNYINIGGIKYNKEPIAKDENGNPKLLTGEEYIEALRKQHKIGITVEDIKTSYRTLPDAAILGVLLGTWFEISTIKKYNDGQEIEQKVKRGVIGTTEFEDLGDTKEYFGYATEIPVPDSEIIVRFSPTSKFYGLSKE